MWGRGAGGMNQALYKVMTQLVNSPDGIKSAVRATNDGQPALAGVDALLRAELGSEYARDNNGARWAGFAVAQVMRDMGYVKMDEPFTRLLTQGMVQTAQVLTPDQRQKVLSEIQRHGHHHPMMDAGE